MSSASFGGSAAFDTKNTGTAKTVTLTGATLFGADAGNYTLASVATAKANISPKAITVAPTTCPRCTGRLIRR